MLALGVPLQREWGIVLGSLAIMAVMGVIVCLGSSIGRAGREESAREAMLAAGLCPSCGYQIDGGAVGVDGCTVCPECGAAWRLPARK